MNFIQRAFKNVTRKYSKSILLIITFFMIGNFVIVGLGVANAAENAKKLTRQKMRAIVTYRVDNQAVIDYTNTITDSDELNDFYSHYPSIKVANIKDLISDKRVATANAFSTGIVYKSEDFDFVHLNNEAESNAEQYSRECEINVLTNEEKCYTREQFVHTIKGNMFPNMIEFIDGGYEIVSGRFYNQEEIDSSANVVLITKALAETNDLKVGDTYTIYVAPLSEIDKYKDYGATEDVVKKDFEIIGIYDHPNKITPGSNNYEYTQPYENPDNMLLMPATTLYLAELEYNQITFDYYADQNKGSNTFNESDRPSYDGINNISVNDVNFLLNDPLEIDQFVLDYQDNLPQFMMLDANNEEFLRLSKPLDTLGLYAKFIIWLVVINAIIIISLVTALTLKTREYEIGVLLSIGASKFKVISQFFIELALVAIIGFTLSVVSGSLIADKVGQTVLEYQIQESDIEENTHSNNDYHSIWDDNYTTSVSLDDLVGEYSVNISPLIIVEIYILGLGIVFISIIIPSMMIMRFNPKKILMNQN